MSHWVSASFAEVGSGPGCCRGGGQPFSCPPTPVPHSLGCLSSILMGRVLPWLVMGGLCSPVLPAWGLYPSSASFTTTVGSPCKSPHLTQLPHPAWSPLSPAVVQSALCGCSVPSGGVLRCSHKRLRKACFSSLGLVAIKVVWMLPWSPLLFTWPLACALPWHQPSLEEPPLSNFLPHSPVPSVPQPLN